MKLYSKEVVIRCDIKANGCLVQSHVVMGWSERLTHAYDIFRKNGWKIGHKIKGIQNPDICRNCKNQ